MFKTTEGAADSAIRSVIRFLKARNILSSEIHWIKSVCWTQRRHQDIYSNRMFRLEWIWCDDIILWTSIGLKRESDVKLKKWRGDKWTEWYATEENQWKSRGGGGFPIFCAQEMKVTDSSFVCRKNEDTDYYSLESITDFVCQMFRITTQFIRLHY